MHLTARLAAFTLATAIGAGAWFALAQAQTGAPQSTTAVTNTNANTDFQPHTNINSTMRGDESAPVDVAETPGEEYVTESLPPDVQWSSAKPSWGYANVSRVTLREGAEANSPAVATIQLADYDSAEILDWTRDRLHVRFTANNNIEGGTRERDYEGWIGWGAVVPGMTAIVLDAESGEVVTRVPLDGSISSATFSPDGRRVLFHGEGSNLAYEADAKDYRPARVLESNTSGGFGRLFYGADGELYAPVWTVNYSETGTESSLDLLKVGGGKSANAPTRIASKGASKFLVAPDRKSGVLIHNEWGATGWSAGRSGDAAGGEDVSSRRASVEILDLSTLETRLSFALYGREAPDEGGELALSRDGTELYVKAAGEEQTVRVFDTRSGGRVREIRLNQLETQWVSLSSANLVGDSLLLNAWQTDEEQGSVQRGLWLSGEKTQAAEKGIDFVTEAGDTRFAVNAAGTELLQLDESNKVTRRLRVARPDIKNKPETDDRVTVHGFTATPDGKHLILFVGIVECGC